MCYRQHQVEQVEQFKYLGSVITEDGRCNKEIKCRIAVQVAKRAFTKNKKILCSNMCMSQNSLARVIFSSAKKRDHISPLLHKLHWLPIEQRIIYKTAVITFKVLHNRQPAYLADLITPQRFARDLCSNAQNLRVALRTKLTTTRRSFAFSAPHIWNSLLPPELRACRILFSF